MSKPFSTGISGPKRSRHREQLPPAWQRQSNGRRQLPLWLELLIGLQHTSSAIAFSLISVALAIYAMTVATQQSWNRQYQKLRHLQYQERNLTATTEALKSQLARQAENSQLNLVPPDPAQTLFLVPSSEPAFTPPAATSETERQHLDSSPIAY